MFQATLNEAREAAELVDKAVLAVQALAAKEPQEFPDRPRLKELRRISRDLAKCESALENLYQ